MGEKSLPRLSAFWATGCLVLLLGNGCGDPEAGPVMEGTLVSSSALRGFLGGKGGLLTWVSQGQIKLLDFRGDNPEIKTLVEDLDSVNPLFSPDGTRLVYSQGNPNGPKFIFVKKLEASPATKLATGDLGYWNFRNGEESIAYADWSDKDQNGAGGSTYRQKLKTGTVELEGSKETLHTRAMDAGPNATLGWLGQVYGQLVAYNVSARKEYPADKFFLLDGSAATHQTCNGSMAPDDSARILVLAIPHDFMRIFSYQSSSDTFRETSRFTMPAGQLEWEFPEWSTHVEYFTTILRSTDLANHLVIVKRTEGASAPNLLEVLGGEQGATFSHLYVQP